MILVGICAHVSNGRRSDNSVLTLGAEEVERKRTELTVAVALHRVTRETERPQSSIQASLGRALARFLKSLPARGRNPVENRDSGLILSPTACYGT